MPSGGQRRASAFETLGAWLKVWTPPRDVEVPPVPVRKVLIGARRSSCRGARWPRSLVPQIDATKDRTAAREAREKAARQAARRREVISQQRVRPRPRGGPAPGLGLAAAQRVSAREALLARAEAAITADARSGRRPAS